MKKLISLCLMLLVCLSLSACSKSDTGIPDDLVVVLPDGQELYLYMPHDDAAEILGAADSVEDFLGKSYNYDDLGLSIAYKNDLLAYIFFNEYSSCQLKNGIDSSSGKSDFIKNGFSYEREARKFYSIEDGRYASYDTDTHLKEDTFQTGAIIGSQSLYNADDPNFKGYSIFIADFHCLKFLDFDSQ